MKPSGGNRFVRLGSFTFDTDAVGSTAFAVNDPFPDPGNNSIQLGTPGFHQIDAEVFGAIPAPIFTVHAVAIPEPSSVVGIAAIMGIAALGARRRSKRRAAQKDSVD